MDKIKVALIGYGHLGKWHAQKVEALEQAELIAIVESFETNRDLAKENHSNAKVVSEISDIIDEIDAAIVVTPTSTHYEIVKELLEAKKHVFCEKPLCSTMEQAQDLEQFIGEQVLQVGHSERCHQAWEQLIEKFSKLSSPKMIRINRYAPFKGRATDVDVVQDLMIHDIDLLLYLFPNKLTKVRSLGCKIRTDKWDHVTSHFTFENGDEAIIVSGRNHTHEERSLEVIGAHGCDYVDLFRNKISYATDSQFDDESFVQEKDYEKRDHLLVEQSYFYNSISKGDDIFVDYAAGTQAMHIISKVLQSLLEKREVEI